MIYPLQVTFTRPSFLICTDFREVRIHRSSRSERLSTHISNNSAKLACSKNIRDVPTIYRKRLEYNREAKRVCFIEIAWISVSV